MGDSLPFYHERVRREDSFFKEWIQVNEADWQDIANFPHPRLKDGPLDVVRAIESPIPDVDGYRLIWFHSSHKRERDAKGRQDRITRVLKGLENLKAKIEGPRCRYTTREGIAQAVEEVISGAGRWISYEIGQREEKIYRQEKRGRPGKDMRWRRRIKIRFNLSWSLIPENIEADKNIDGIFPLLTNCRNLSMLEVLTAYKCKQPLVEKRHDLLKNTLEVTPIFLKSISRLEAFLFLSYIAIVVHALIERELRKAMEAKNLKAVPMYPEERDCKAPTTARIIELFGNLQRHVLFQQGKIVQRFPPELTEIHRKILRLLRIPVQKYLDA